MPKKRATSKSRSPARPQGISSSEISFLVWISRWRRCTLVLICLSALTWLDRDSHTRYRSWPRWLYLLFRVPLQTLRWWSSNFPGLEWDSSEDRSHFYLFLYTCLHFSREPRYRVAWLSLWTVAHNVEVRYLLLLACCGNFPPLNLLDQLTWLRWYAKSQWQDVNTPWLSRGAHVQNSGCVPCI